MEQFYLRLFAQKVAKNSEYGNIINACYNSDFAKQIKTRLLPYLSIWTGIMRQYFNKSGEIATSSSVEAEFSDLKNRAFKDQLPMRIDKFVMQHLHFLDAKVTLASNEKDICTKNDRPLQLDEISVSNKTLVTKKPEIDRLDEYVQKCDDKISIKADEIEYTINNTDTFITKQNSHETNKDFERNLHV